MPRRRQRKTNRVPQDERRLRVRGIRCGTPDAKKLSRAFMGLALARAEAEAKAQAEAEDAACQVVEDEDGENAETRNVGK